MICNASGCINMYPLSSNCPNSTESHWIIQKSIQGPKHSQEFWKIHCEKRERIWNMYKFTKIMQSSKTKGLCKGSSERGHQDTGDHSEGVTNCSR